MTYGDLDASKGEAGALADRRAATPVTEELTVLGAMAASLAQLDVDARDRILSYLSARFQSQQSAQRLTPTSAEMVSADGDNDSELGGGTPDIRSFRETKGPTSGQEMAAVLAFYLSEVLPEGQRRDSIGPADIDKYFKQAGFPLPARTRAVLTHAKTAGYLEEAGGRGAYKLSPVGYNLVKYRLPRGTEPTSTPRGFRRRARRSKPPVTPNSLDGRVNDES